MWISKKLILDITDNFSLRIRSFANASLVIAGVLLLHTDKLHIPHPYDDWLILGCMIIMAFNRSVKDQPK